MTNLVNYDLFSSGSHLGSNTCLRRRIHNLEPSFLPKVCPRTLLQLVGSGRRRDEMTHTAAANFSVKHACVKLYITVRSAHNLPALSGSCFPLLLLLLSSLLISRPFSREHPSSRVRHRLCRTWDGCRHASTVCYRGFCLAQLFNLSLSDLSSLPTPALATTAPRCSWHPVEPVKPVCTHFVVHGPSP